MRIWTPKNPKKPKRKSLLRSVAKTAAEVLYPSLACGRQVTKFPSKLFVPQPLRMQSLGFPCCCDELDCLCNQCSNGAPCEVSVEFFGIKNNDCETCDSYYNNLFILNFATEGGGSACCYNVNKGTCSAYILGICIYSGAPPFTYDRIQISILHPTDKAKYWAEETSVPLSDCNFKNKRIEYYITNPNYNGEGDWCNAVDSYCILNTV